MEKELTPPLSAKEDEQPAHKQLKPLPTTTPTLQSTSMQLQPLPSCSTRFNCLKTDEEVEAAKKLATPKNTEKNTTWAVKVWKD